jgi:hypothetical protein
MLGGGKCQRLQDAIRLPFLYQAGRKHSSAAAGRMKVPPQNVIVRDPVYNPQSIDRRRKPEVSMQLCQITSVFISVRWRCAAEDAMVATIANGWPGC